MKIARPSVLSLILCLSPAALADDAPIGALLERMEAAVLAGDSAAYLECVDRSHPEWAREQINWAADLAGHTPEAFDMALTGEPAGEDGPAGKVGGLKIRWTLPGGREHSVEFAARFTPGEGGWLFAGEAWTELASTDGQNIVLYLDDGLENTALQVIEAMPEIRGHVDEGFGATLDHPQVIKLYTDMGHLQESIYLSYTDPLGGWNEPGEAIKIMASERMGARQMRTLLAHEYGHVATFTYSPDASNNIPWWAAEGAAELAAEKFAGRRGREAVNEVVRAWANAGRLADWADMADFRETPSSLHGHVYTQGHQFLGYLSERFGRESRNLWLRRLAEGAGVEKATSEAFGLAFDQLDREWRASLEAGPDEADEN